MARDRRSKRDSEEEEQQQQLTKHKAEISGNGKSTRRNPKSDSESESESSSESKSESERERGRRRRISGGGSRRRRSRKGRDRDSESEESESEEERRRRRRRRQERRKREERERRKEKERKKKRKRDDEDEKRKKKKKGKVGAVTDTWGKYGVIRESDMWNKRPEFSAWLAEVRQVNLESLPNWEEKKMFKEYMEDYNTATFPSKKYYDLDAYHKQQLEKQMRKGIKKVMQQERTVFNDEEQRRQELLRERQKAKDQEVEALKNAMRSGMAQAMKEQALLKEEMVLQYKLGNFEAAAAIQRKLDPDAAP